MGYAIKKSEVKASTTMRASHTASLKIARSVNGKRFAEAKKFVSSLASHGRNLDGKFHDKAAEGIVKLLDCLESNARQKKVAAEGLNLMISVHKGPKLMRGRRRRRHGMAMKNTRVQAVLVIPRQILGAGGKSKIPRQILGAGEKSNSSPRSSDGEILKSEIAAAKQQGI